MKENLEDESHSNLVIIQKFLFIFVVFTLIVPCFINVTTAQARGHDQPSPELRSEKVMCAGSMNIIWGASTTVMAVRAEYMPAGSGTAILIRSDVLADGRTADDIQAVFTDSLELVDFLQRQVFYEIPLFGKPDSKRTLPVYQAKITRDLVGTRYLTEQIEAEDMKLELT